MWFERCQKFVYYRVLKINSKRRQSQSLSPCIIFQIDNMKTIMKLAVMSFILFSCEQAKYNQKSDSTKSIEPAIDIMAEVFKSVNQTFPLDITGIIEKYRFHHFESLSNKNTIITISKSTLIKVHLLVFTIDAEKLWNGIDQSPIITKSDSVNLTKSDWDLFKALMEASYFLSMETKDKYRYTEDIDGDSWVI